MTSSRVHIRRWYTQGAESHEQDIRHLLPGWANPFPSPRFLRGRRDLSVCQVGEQLYGKRDNAHSSQVDTQLLPLERTALTLLSSSRNNYSSCQSLYFSLIKALKCSSILHWACTYGTLKANKNKNKQKLTMTYVRIRRFLVQRCVEP